MIIIILLLILYFFTMNGRIYNRFKSRFEINGHGVFPTSMVYCICMPNRLGYARKQMSTLGTQYKLLHAISPKELNILDYMTMSPNVYINPRSKVFMKYTKLAVDLSFFMCFYDAYLNGYDSITIFEDDIEFEASPNQIKSLVTEFLETKQEILFLGYCWHNCKNKSKHKQVSQNIYQIPFKSSIFCNHALSMKKGFISKYIKSFPFPFYTTTNDHSLSTYMIRNKIKKAIPRRAVVSQNYSLLKSNNGNNNENIHKTTCDLGPLL